MTVEDPIEYDLDGIGQTQVNPAIEMTFARALRAILRQDPDVVMIGEIRDLETAQIAVQASLTGHLVFATLHTNDAAGAVTRLIDMGVEPFLLASSLLGVLAQRLVRKLCPECRKPGALSAAERERGAGAVCAAGRCTPPRAARSASAPATAAAPGSTSCSRSTTSCAASSTTPPRRARCASARSRAACAAARRRPALGRARRDDPRRGAAREPRGRRVMREGVILALGSARGYGPSRRDE